MGRKRLRGPLDPLYRIFKHSTVIGLAELLSVSRQTINRWQRGGEISPYNRMKINLLFIGRGLRPPFPEKRRERQALHAGR